MISLVASQHMESEMKKVFGLALVSAAALSLAACSGAAKDETAEAADAVVTDIENVADESSAMMENAGDAMADKADAAADKADAMMGDADEKAGAAIDKAADKAKAVTGDAMESAGDAMKKAGEEVKN
jgi:ElaB/YqjD/DUF883 family membrane-anchored ribosome-binding protein